MLILYGIHTECGYGVGLYWWSVVIDEVQPAAGQSVEDIGALVFFQSTSAPDPDLACAYRQRLCTNTGHFRSWSRALHRQWRQLTNTRHRQIVLRWLTADMQYSAVSPTARPVVAHPCVSRHSSARSTTAAQCWPVSQKYVSARKNPPRRKNNGIIISPPHYEDVAYPMTMSPPLIKIPPQCAW